MILSTISRITYKVNALAAGAFRMMNCRQYIMKYSICLFVISLFSLLFPFIIFWFALKYQLKYCFDIRFANIVNVENCKNSHKKEVNIDA